MTHSVSTDLAAYLDDRCPIAPPRAQHVAGIFDVHFPAQDPGTWGAFTRYARDTQPDVIVLGGDFVDLESMSSHGGNPTPPTFIAEIAPAREALQELRRICPNARIVYLEGNHETRLTRWLANNAKSLHGAIDLPSMLGLAELGIEWKPEGVPLKLGKLHFVHGFWTTDAHAKKHLMEYGSSVTYGHTHRPQSYTRGLVDGSVHGAFGMPCACKLDAPYLKNKPSGWLNGWGVYYVLPDGCFNAYSVFMNKGVAVAPNGVIYA